MPRADFALRPVQSALVHVREYKVLAGLQRHTHAHSEVPSAPAAPCHHSLSYLTSAATYEPRPSKPLPFAEPLHTRLVPSSSVWLHSPLSSPIPNASSLFSSLAFPFGAPGLSRPQSLGRTTTHRRFCSFASPLLSLRLPSIRPVELLLVVPPTPSPTIFFFFLTSSARARCISHSTRFCAALWDCPWVL